MRKFLTSILASCLALQATSTAGVTYSFNTFAGGTAPFEQGADATSIAWSGENGGSVALNFATGWKPSVAKINLASDPNLWAEYQNCLLLGGTLTFKLHVISDELVSTAPGYFESILIANSAGNWDQHFGAVDGLLGLYGAGGFTSGVVTTINVSYRIEVDSGPTRDRALQFSAGSGWNEIFFGMNSGGGTTGAVPYAGGTYYVDELTLAANVVPPTVVIPKIDITEASRGLHVVNAGSSQWNREGVRTVNPDYSWIDQGGPVSYSMTIKTAPHVADQQIYMYLAPGTGVTSISPDWSLPVCMQFTVFPAANGTGWGRLSYKDDVVDSNGQVGHEYWAADDGTGKGGMITSLGSATVEGTWTVRFDSNTSVTLLSPDGGSATGTLLPATAAKFGPSLYTYFGSLAGIPANIANKVIFSALNITGVPSPITQTFNGTPLTNLLEKSAADPDAVIPVSGPAYFLKWSIPSTGFVLQQSTDLGNLNSWIPAGLTYYDLGSKSERIATYHTAPGMTEPKLFFRLQKP